MRRSFLLAVVAMTLFAALPALAAEPGTDELQRQPDVIDEGEPPRTEQTPLSDHVADGEGAWIVKLVPGRSARTVAPGLVRGAGADARVTHVYEHVFDGFAFRGSAQAAEALERNPNVERVEAVRVFDIAGEFASNGLFRIDGNVTYGAGDRGLMDDGTPVRIAILDTGITPTHPDLAPNYDPSQSTNCINPGQDPIDDQGHGTHVAGIAAAADQGDGLVGIASKAKIVVAKVLNAAGSGTDAEVICGIDFIAGLAQDGVPTVANFSLGDGVTEGPECTSSLMHEAICRLYDAGVTIVAAAGNNAVDTADFIPASYPETIAVSAFSDLNGSGSNDDGNVVLDCQFELSLFGFICDETISVISNWGPLVDVAAPGVKILSTDMNGGTSIKTGTSMAAPFAAGVAALVLAENPSLKSEDVRDILRESGECPDGSQSGASTCVGKGQWLVGNGLGSKAPESDGIAEPLVNAAWAVETAASPTVPDEVPPSVSVGVPGENVMVSAPVLVSGSVADDVGVDHVQVQIIDRDTGLFWDGVSGWTASWTRFDVSVDVPGSSSTGWSYSFDPAAPYASQAYILSVRSFDTSGNPSSWANRNFFIG